MPIGSSCTAKVSQIYQSTKKIALFFKTTTRKNLADGLEELDRLDRLERLERLEELDWTVENGRRSSLSRQAATAAVQFVQG